MHDSRSGNRDVAPNRVSLLARPLCATVCLFEAVARRLGCSSPTDRCQAIVRAQSPPCFRFKLSLTYKDLLKFVAGVERSPTDEALTPYPSVYRGESASEDLLNHG